MPLSLLRLSVPTIVRILSAGTFWIATMFAMVPLASAQHQEIQALAREVAKDLTQERINIIGVTYFRSTGGAISEAGRVLSIEFAAALVADAPQIRIISVGELQALAKDRHLMPSDVFNSDVARELSLVLGAKAYVRGTLSLAREDLRLDLEWVDVPSQGKGERISCGPKRLGRASTEIVGSPELVQLFAKPISEDHSDYLAPGIAGATFPKCEYCPTPSFTPQARKKRVQGVVFLLITITPAGGVESPVHICGPGEGLDAAAVKAVETWRFRPAEDSEGKPHAMRLEVEVAFRLLP